MITNPFPVLPNSGSHYEMINFLKRKDETRSIKIGGYENIRPFEAANRIATTRYKGKGDFTIKINGEEYEGEAFNVAPLFLKQKMKKT